jgi:hypothetical protein
VDEYIDEALQVAENVKMLLDAGVMFTDDFSN